MTVFASSRVWRVATHRHFASEVEPPHYGCTLASPAFPFFVSSRAILKENRPVARRRKGFYAAGAQIQREYHRFSTQLAGLDKVYTECAMSAIPTDQDYYGEALPPYAQQAPAEAGHATARCKGCGQQFARKEGVNPASAQFHRCDNCNNRATRDMLCVNATCGASSLCAIQ
ncbi:unnamed protein product [Pylaiella littoralis]